MKRTLATAAGILACFAAYVSGYYQFVNIAWMAPGNSGQPVFVKYKVGGAFAELVFRPMELLDRQLRPEWWAGFPAIPPWDQSQPLP